MDIPWKLYFHGNSQWLRGYLKRFYSKKQQKVKSFPSEDQHIHSGDISDLFNLDLQDGSNLFFW